MKPKINLEKFICSYVKWNNIQDALKDQGLKCWNGEIVEIESEDERIKKEILDLVSISGNGNQFEEIKDWLEKQGEQKSMWTDEDEELLQHCCGAVAAADYYTLEDKEEMETQDRGRDD